MRTADLYDLLDGAMHDDELVEMRWVPPQDRHTIACTDPSACTDTELARLEELGFHADTVEECFYSFRYGSA